MSMTTEKIAHIVSKIVCETTDQALEQIEAALATGSLSRRSGIREWTGVTSPSLIPVPQLQDLITEWHAVGIDAAALLSLFQTAKSTKNMMQARIPSVEIAWTGPNTSFLGRVRTNYSVLKNMIEQATKDILLVGYSYTANDFTQNILDSLADARIRGCMVKIAFDKRCNNHAKLLNHWRPNAPRPVLLKWRGNKEDDKATLHAKMLVVDNRELFITSANLTYHGMGGNIEMGVRLSGEAAQKVSRHFFALQQEGELLVH
jgi:phosphatidylserine/phosphatidylglycerophosphate/cardiolipin synthase-like enzyme